MLQARKALIQGAKFVMHRGWDQQLKLVWYDSTYPQAVKWEGSTAIPKMGMAKKGLSQKQNAYSQPAPNMGSIAVGTHPFKQWITVSLCIGQVQ